MMEDGRAVNRSDLDFEAVFGGRVLAWLGGVAVLIGLVLLFALGVSQGWIGEGARAIAGGLVSAGLLGFGAWLHERRGRTHASLAAASAGIAGLFLTAGVATTTYNLLPAGAGLALALGTGTLSTVLALRWDARGVAALGIVGGLLAPVLAGAPLDPAAVALMFVAAASAVGVLVHRRWGWLAFAVFVCTAPQWATWVLEKAGPAGILITLAAFGGLYLVAALGFELRVASPGLRPSSAFLLAFNALVIGLVGWIALDDSHHQTAGRLFLASLAVAHLAAGALAQRGARVNDEIAALTLTLGVVLADVAWGLTAGGAVLTAGWVLGGLSFAGVARRMAGTRSGGAFVSLGLGAHTALALATALAGSGQSQTFASGGLPQTAVLLSLATVAAGSFVSARLADDGLLPWRQILDTTGLLVLAYLTALSLDGVALTAAYAAEAVALAAIAAPAKDTVATIAAVGNLAIAGIYALATQAPLSGLYDGLGDVPRAVVGLGAILVAVATMIRVGFGGRAARPALLALAGAVALYLASLVVVSLPDGTASSSLFGDEVGVHQQGQMLLSALWAIVGIGTLVAGLIREERTVRLAALGLLGATAAKVFFFDLATLTSVYRVGSFIGFGLLLLGGAYAYQRLRPEPLPDLRHVPKGLR
jgi:uncharacterized membrane protein